MMLRPLRLTHLAASVAALSLALASGFGEAAAAARSAGRLVDAGGSLVLCLSVPLPVQVSATGHAPIRRIKDERFFAPTRQAMFFSHPGDRCVWHAGGPARG